MERLIMLLIPAIHQTLYMVSLSTLFAVLVGTPLGILLVVTRRGHIMENIGIHQVLSYIVNMGRSFPYIILMIALIPFTRLLIGTSIGTTATVVPLTIATIPFFSRVIENALLEVDKGVIEASQAMGASTFQIIYKVLIPESMPSIVLGITITIVNVIGYSAMAGAVGGGGLGDLAIRYGFHRYNKEVMIWTVVLLILLVQIVQITGNYYSKNLSRR
ncbi:binding-protein-dependent transport systems inner membrane component [Alkaliphilus metalliredigens QYMF]|uniref:Binding-protein-dependent transport systems inner membrane component n=1 Tax=Alkaliphilus metalliredigens (strain QYMF) TaxID=293826 RepID=A6TLT3_ALKMQ|nr:methionine ABC transporter permease [Alkaliphilus metalliredigens]ABR47151.1 binding-protein-dependent transport systems inner membrane component [Alkaliphilus metalliredigens QYMF]